MNGPAVEDWPEKTMAALAVQASGAIEPIRVDVPRAAPRTVLIRPRYVGLCGTDLELVHGTASYLRDGRTGHPHIFGHEWWGEVAATTEGTGFRPGDKIIGHTMVSCARCAACQSGSRSLCLRLTEVGLYGQQGAAAEYIRMPAHALTPLPDSLATPGAVVVEPAVTVVEAFERARVGLSDNVAVVGTGTIGLLAVQLAARIAGEVHAVGVDPAGLDLARRFGAAQAHRAETAPEQAYSVVVEASGAAEAFALSLRLARTGGRTAVIGVAGEPTQGLVAGDITLRGLSVLGIRHGLDQYPRTVGLLADGVLAGDPLIAGRYPPERAQEAFDVLAGGRSGPPKVVLDLTEAGWDATGVR